LPIKLKNKLTNSQNVLSNLKYFYHDEKDAKIKIRLLIVIHFLNNKSVSEIAKILLISRDQAYYWLNKYKNGGVHALATKKKTGRPSKVNYGQLRKILNNSPKNYGFKFDFWHIPSIQAVIKQEMGVEVHENYVYDLLRKINWRNDNKSRIEIGIPINQTGHKVTEKHFEMIKTISNMLKIPIDRIIKENSLNPVLNITHTKKNVTIIEGKTDNGRLLIKYEEFN